VPKELILRNRFIKKRGVKGSDAQRTVWQHEAIITEAMFYDVQDALWGRRRAVKTKIISMDMLPLRGFLGCSKCTRTLSESASKGRKEY
jgi:hypothetical protein